MHISPILETIFTLSENDLSPIILLDPFALKSSTGSVLIFTPIDLKPFRNALTAALYLYIPYK